MNTQTPAVAKPDDNLAIHPELIQEFKKTSTEKFIVNTVKPPVNVVEFLDNNRFCQIITQGTAEKTLDQIQLINNDAEETYYIAYLLINNNDLTLAAQAFYEFDGKNKNSIDKKTFDKAFGKLQPQWNKQPN
ncbi:MAG TPA: hypothetical protein VGF14_00700 [Alphaproteobacteria bacterium]